MYSWPLTDSKRAVLIQQIVDHVLFVLKHQTSLLEIAAVLVASPAKTMKINVQDNEVGVGRAENKKWVGVEHEWNGAYIEVRKL